MRQPRADELALMQRLSDGPMKVDTGPIGRCVKRGWCRPVIQELDAKGASSVLYMLTDAGRALIEATDQRPPVRDRAPPPQCRC